MKSKNNVLFIGVLSFLLLVQIGTFEIYQVANAQSEITVPDWIKNLAKFWSDEDISDKEFVTAIEFLIQSKIITSERLSIVDEIDVNIQGNETEIKIPNWIRNNAKWFAENIIEDSDFVLGIEYMVEEKIIQSPRIKIIEIESDSNTNSLPSDSDIVPVVDSDGDGILDDVDVCPNQAETINGFEDSDGCPDTIPLPDKSLTISDVDIEWHNSGWGNQKINLSWTYHVDESQVGFPEDGYFVIEITGIETVIEKANYVEENKFAGQYEGIDPGVGGGTVTITVISFIGDEWNYEGDGNQEEVIIPPNTS